MIFVQLKAICVRVVYLHDMIEKFPIVIEFSKMACVNSPYH